MNQCNDKTAAAEAERIADQHDLIEQLVYPVAESWSKTFDQPELLRYNNLPVRLDEVVRSVLVELEGDGGVQPHRLALKGNPDADLLVDRASPRYVYPPTSRSCAGVDPEIVIFVDALWLARNRIADDVSQDNDTRQIVGALLIAICEIIEAGYVLVPQFYDDHGAFEKEGQDIAPGLAAAFKKEWEIKHG